MRFPHIVTGLLLAAAGAATTSVSRGDVIRSEGTTGKPRVVAVGDVSVFSSAADDVRPDEVRTETMSALATVDLSSVPAQSRALVSMTFVRVSPTRERPEASCIVTALVRDLRKEALVATIETRARGSSSGSSSAEERHAMMRSAVRGAIAQLPAALVQ